MHTLDLQRHPALRGYIRAAERGELVLITEGALVVGYLAIPGVKLAPREQALLDAAAIAATPAAAPAELDHG